MGPFVVMFHAVFQFSSYIHQHYDIFNLLLVDTNFGLTDWRIFTPEGQIAVKPRGFGSMVKKWTGLQLLQEDEDSLQFFPPPTGESPFLGSHKHHGELVFLEKLEAPLFHHTSKTSRPFGSLPFRGEPSPNSQPKTCISTTIIFFNLLHMFP